MYNPEIIKAHWIRGGHMNFPEPIEIYSSRVNDYKTTKVKKVLNLVNEPRRFRQDNLDIIKVQKRFDLILSFDPQILNACDNSKMMACGMTWIDSNDINKIGKKEFGVSFLCGGKKITQGHNLRQRVWERQNDIGIPKKFWISSANPVKAINKTNTKLPAKESEKYHLFKQQFHVAVENCVEDNYFTEKIIDCFMTKTIPVYWGCNNLGDFFNMNGVIRFDNLQQLINKLNSLTPDYYEKHLEAIEDNYQRCQKYAEDFTTRLERHINYHLFKVGDESDLF